MIWAKGTVVAVISGTTMLAQPAYTPVGCVGLVIVKIVTISLCVVHPHRNMSCNHAELES